MADAARGPVGPAEARSHGLRHSGAQPYGRRPRTKTKEKARMADPLPAQSRL